jgi:hypothetical protein
LSASVETDFILISKLDGFYIPIDLPRQRLDWKVTGANPMHVEMYRNICTSAVNQTLSV